MTLDPSSRRGPRRPDAPDVHVAALATGRDEVRLESLLLGVRPNDAWEYVTTAAGINSELAPFLTMRPPPGATWNRVSDAPVGAPAGRCPILLLGLVPVDHDDLFVEEVGPGLRFQERSRMTTLRLWGHERVVTAHPDGCVVADRVLFEVEPRLVRTRPVHRRVVAALFRHRHRRLREVVGPRLAEPSS